MEEAMQLQPNWDFRIHESAQRSIAAGHYFFSCISGQAHKRSPQELSIIAEGAILEFKKLISILDSSVLHSTKRIKKGPLFNNPSINPSELTEKLISPASVANYQQKQSSNLTHPFLRPSESFNLSRQSHSSLIQRCYSDTDLTLANNPFLVLDGSVSQASTADPSRQTNESSVSLQLNSFGYKSILQFSSSSMQSAPEDFSVRFGGIREEGSSKCAASTGGCHCSKRKKLRIKRTIRVPAVSSKLSDIPSDDFSWRKYGQKPIKGSPYPRSYYKCSSLRGCPARKHVERSLEDPSMLVITYEGQHSHSRITFGIPNILIQQQH